MRMRGHHWSRVAATSVLSLLTAAAVILHQQAGSDSAKGVQPATADPHAGHIMPEAVPVAVTTAAPLPRTGWTITADSEASAAERVLDGNAGTSWKSGSGAMPHSITIDTHNRIALSGLTYMPSDGADGRIGRYRVDISDDGTKWSTNVASGAKWSTNVATGTFADDDTVKTVTIGTTVTRYVRLSVLSEAGDRVSWISAAEINLLGGTDPALPRTGWTVTADSQETARAANAAVNAIDGNTATIWHSAWSSSPPKPLPHTFTIDMHKYYLVSGLSYLPRQDSSKNGNIGSYKIETSMNGTLWAPQSVTGQFGDLKTAQTVTIPSQIARYVRLTATSEAGKRGPWSSAAEFNVLGRDNPALPRTGWTATADSQETTTENDPASKALDNSNATYWHSQYSPAPAKPLPHWITVNMGKVQAVGGLLYQPRPATNANGRPGSFKIETSTDNKTWSTRISAGKFGDSAAPQTAVFPPVDAQYLRFTATTEAGNRGPWTSISELFIFGASGSVSPNRGTWSAPVGFPLIPVAAALLPNGKVLTWSAYAPDTFSGGNGLRTLTATFDPATGVVTQRTVTETGHDMFCPGISVLPDGRVIVTGGNNNQKTSIYDPATDAWTDGGNMTTGRGYQASVTLGSGKVFTIGGSWSGPVGGTGSNPHKAGEVWSADAGWHALPGANVVPMLTNDSNTLGDYRKDNHAWLFAWKGDKILQAGPSKAMNWYSIDGNGSVSAAGTRSDADEMNGSAVMFDTGKILTLGGSPSYNNSDATADAHLLTINDDGTVSVRKVGSMANTRAFQNSVVLPDGKVLVIGGENYAVPFSDNTAVLNAELWDPTSGQFSTMGTMAVPRTYHSVALLLPDGRVFTGGGGLCGTGCATNHFDGQIFTPPYLLNADGSAAERPEITDAPDSLKNGDGFNVTTGSAVTSFAIVRMGTATHSVDTDQRRLSLPLTINENGTYRLTIPADPGVAVPGYWMLFALNSKGVPSVGHIVHITN
ncbi:discoidin domain-containing protein [Actinoplanes sp. KI2]|uniref:discoidin domain-containing protein n=1 Tax=Actinoplanes sp. KI2 TaxID=2983315 RepID=UPI0021D5B00A|nr:discoidin domain-containing protein [Actinoplanes sp. KI2]MCU7722172.1 discoidin domain-containing protein [Actinoplanes sp. KI2]